MDKEHLAVSVILVVLPCNINSSPLPKQALDPTDGRGGGAAIKPRSSYYGSKLAFPKPEAPREIAYNMAHVEKRQPEKSGSPHSFTSYGSAQPSHYNPVSSPLGTGFVESLSSSPSSAQSPSKPSAPMPEFPWLVPPHTHYSRKFPRGSPRQPSITSVYGSSTAPQYLSGEGASEQDYWAVAGPMHPVSRESSSGRVAHGSETKQPASVGYMHASPAVLLPGEYTQVEGVFEHGSHESEVEDSAQPPLRHPAMDMFPRGYFPRGVISHHIRSFEEGRDHWEDSYYNRDRIGRDKPIPHPNPIGPSIWKDTGSSEQQSNRIQEISSHIGSGYETVKPALFDTDYMTDVGGSKAVFWAKPAQSVGDYGAGRGDNPGYYDIGYQTDMGYYGTGSQAYPGYSAVGSTTDVVDYGTYIQANPGYSGVGTKTNVRDYGYWDERGVYHSLYRPHV